MVGVAWGGVWSRLSCLFFFLVFLFFSQFDAGGYSHCILLNKVPLPCTGYQALLPHLGLDQSRHHCSHPHLIWPFGFFFTSIFVHFCDLDRYKRDLGFEKKKKVSTGRKITYFSICIFLFSCSAREEDLRIPTKKKDVAASFTLFSCFYYFFSVCFFLLCALFTLINELTWFLCFVLFFSSN